MECVQVDVQLDTGELPAVKNVTVHLALAIQQAIVPVGAFKDMVEQETVSSVSIMSIT